MKSLNHTSHIKNFSCFNDVPKINKRSVLIAEDDPILCRIHVENFKPLNWKIITTDLGQTVLENFPAYDVILLDINLPDMSGIKICEFIRKKTMPKIPIVVGISAYGDDIKNECLNAGFDMYFSKPIDYEKLLEELLRFGQ